MLLYDNEYKGKENQNWTNDKKLIELQQNGSHFYSSKVYQFKLALFCLVSMCKIQKNFNLKMRQRGVINLYIVQFKMILG